MLCPPGARVFPDDSEGLLRDWIICVHSGNCVRIGIMKKHAIIPIFIPHLGCPNDCVFCNQRKITARSTPASEDDVRNTIEKHLSTLENQNLDEIEIAFFGGSFTGIPLEEQSEYLSVALEYKNAGRIDKIHLSTRPDYINEEVLDNLRGYSADIIELGVQSFDPEVLRASKRGHSADSVYSACSLIRRYGFDLGIQLMIGLPGDNRERAINSAREALKIGPDLIRLYPTVVLEGTELAEMLMRGTFTPLPEEEMLNITKEMYKILDVPGINIIRVGLKSTDLITGSSDLGGGYHPAFRQLVEGAIAREKLEAELVRLNLMCAGAGAGGITEVLFLSNEKSFPAMIGHRACNKKHFQKTCPCLNIKYGENAKLRNNEYRIEVVK